jgi:hypothetical protein
MFISKERAIVVPQSEHQRLAGILAHHWGNDEFTLPDVHVDAFKRGVAIHDQAFGLMDTKALGAITEAERSVQVAEWLNIDYGDPETALVVLLHVRRLMNTPERQTLYAKLDQRISEIVQEQGINLSEYEAADTITGLCDLIAFDFSFESPIERTLSVYKNKEGNVDITYKFSAGEVLLSDWPFNIDSITGNIIGYEQEGYPDEPVPVELEFTIKKA